MAEHEPDFWDEAMALIKAAPIGFLATAGSDQPHVRAVTPAYVGVNLYIAAGAGSPMLRQMIRNPRVELLHWTRDFRHLHIIGLATVQPGAQAADVEQHFPYSLDDFFAPDRSDMSVISITTRRISITTLADIAADRPPRVWRADG